MLNLSCLHSTKLLEQYSPQSQCYDLGLLAAYAEYELLVSD